MDSSRTILLNTLDLVSPLVAARVGSQSDLPAPVAVGSMVGWQHRSLPRMS